MSIDPFSLLNEDEIVGDVVCNIGKPENFSEIDNINFKYLCEQLSELYKLEKIYPRHASLTGILNKINNDYNIDQKRIMLNKKSAGSQEKYAYEMKKNNEKMIKDRNKAIQKDNENKIKRREIISKRKDILIKKIFLCVDPNKVNYYSLLRLLCPELDNERSSYKIQESRLAELYIKILNLDKLRPDLAAKLKNYNSMEYNSRDFGDLPETIGMVLNELGTINPSKKSLNIMEVNEFLNQLSISSMVGNQLRTYMSNYILNVFTPIEQVWITRIILKKMRIGINGLGVLKIFDDNAKKIWIMSTSLKKIADHFLNNPHTVDPNYFYPKIGVACRPQLCSRLPSFADIIKSRFMSGGFLVEDKYDGERLLIHKIGKNMIKLYSRKGVDMTDTFGGVKGKFIKETISHSLNKLDTCILDGELMTWDEEAERYANFGSNRLTEEKMSDTLHHCYIVFDVLALNGESVINIPLIKRKMLLQESITPVDHRFEISKYMNSNTEKINTPQLLQSILVDAINRGREGIVIKAINETYTPGIRSKRWIKARPDYFGNLTDDIDVFVLGGYYNKSKKISDVLVGIPGNGKIFTFAKVGVGLSYSDIEYITNELPWKKVDSLNKSKIPSDVSIEDLQKTVILTIRFSNLISNNNFTAGITPRFARVVKMRNDKEWKECDTKSRVEKLREFQLEGKRYTFKDMEESKEIIDYSKDVYPYLAAENKVSDIFTSTTDKHCIFVVHLGLLQRKEQYDIQKLIKSNGGIIHASTGNSTQNKDLIIVDKNNIFYRLSIRLEHGWTLVDKAWVYDSFKQKIKLPMDKYIVTKQE